MTKPKLKKIHQAEVFESPMEKLRRLENGKHSRQSLLQGILKPLFSNVITFFESAQPVDEDTESEAEEVVVSLPDYDLPTKRAKTKLEEYTVEEKITKKKPKKQRPKEPAEWDRHNQKEPEKPDKRPSLIMGQGHRGGISSIS